VKSGLDAFFEYARQRQLCYVMKNANPEWCTPDPILREYSFCNVFREDDKTTKWLAKNVRGPMDKARDPRLMLAVVLFRMFNRIESGEAMFRDDNLLGDHSAFDEYWRTGKTTALRQALIRRQGKKGPFVTGAYIIAGPGGMSKLDGMLRVVDQFRRGTATFYSDEMGWKEVVEDLGKGRHTMEELHRWFSQFDYFGNFHAYEIVTDLRWTHLLRRATDIYTWASPGPGCRRGLNRVFGRDKDAKPWKSKEALLEEMDVILDESTRARQWSNFAHQMMDRHGVKTPLEWEMRDVEHTLCEFDKYERTRAGEGRPRGKYRGNEAARR
jgi:5-hmdU DNA kinase-like protein